VEAKMAVEHLVVGNPGSAGQCLPSVQNCALHYVEERSKNNYEPLQIQVQYCIGLV
jgi:hypothetical protein